jgi:pyruvate kinase
MRSQVRMNFSHGSYEYHQSVIDNTRKMLAGTLVGDPAFSSADIEDGSADPDGRPVAIALDTVCGSILYLRCAIA